MEQRRIIARVAKEVKRRLRVESPSHDWWHVYRVWKMAKKICHKEGGDIFVIELAALLHDIADWKFHRVMKLLGQKLRGKYFLILGFQKK